MPSLQIKKSDFKKIHEPGAFLESGSGFDALYDSVYPVLERDRLDFRKQDFIFLGRPDVGNASQHTVSLVNAWQDSPDAAPSLTAMVSVACEKFTLPDDVAQKAVMLALLGDIEHDNPFHNNTHFQKVMLQMIRLIAVHNNTHAGTEEALNPREIAMLLVGAAIHDLGHNGQSNLKREPYQPGALEQRAFDLAAPYLKNIGFDENEREAFNVLLLSTDTSEKDGRRSYCSLMKQVYDAHYRSGSFEGLDNLPEGMALLRTNKRLALMACLLHEADIATSAGLDYRISQLEGSLIAQETGVGSLATPEGLLEFLEEICENRMRTAAGQYLYADNMKNIAAQAHADLNASSQTLQQRLDA